MKYLIQNVTPVALAIFVFTFISQSVSGQCIDTLLIDGSRICTTQYDPVCGCDGITYNNACEAQFQYGITAWSKGPCSSKCVGCLIDVRVNSKILSSGELCQISYTLPDTGENYVLDFGDGEVLILEQRAETIPHAYAYPGYYEVEVRSVTGEVSSKQNVTVISCGWSGFFTDGEKRLAKLSPCDFITNDQMQLPASQAGSDLYWSNFMLNRPMGNVGEGTTLSARIKVSNATGGISCYDPTLQLVGEHGKALIRFMQPGCSYYSKVVAGDTEKNGSSVDLSGLVADFSDWVVLALRLQNDTMYVLSNDDTVYQMGYAGLVGEVWGFGVSFKGSGQVDWIEWKNNDTEHVLYRDDFASCTVGEALIPNWNIAEKDGTLRISDGSQGHLLKILGIEENILFSQQDTIHLNIENQDSLQIVTTDGCNTDTVLWKKQMILPDTICFSTNEMTIQNADSFEVPIYASGDGQLSGLQLGLEIADSRLQINSVSSPLPGWNADNYVIDSGNLQFVWIGLDGTYQVSPDEPIFVLTGSWSSQEDTCIVPFANPESVRILGEHDGTVSDIEICFDFARICFDLFWTCQGQIIHRDGAPFPEVLVEADSLKDVTDADGSYQLRGLKKDSVHISAMYVSDPHQDVDVLDMVALYRHQLKLEELQENYCWLAGDVDDNGALTLADLAVMQLLLLGKIDQWPNEKTWRFTPENNLYGEDLLLSDPPIVAFRSLPNPVGVGIKIGDVVRERNRSARAASDQISLSYKGSVIGNDLVYTIDLSPFQNWQGLQMNIAYDDQHLSWVSTAANQDYINEIEPGDLRIVYLNKDRNLEKIELSFHLDERLIAIPDLVISEGSFKSKLVLPQGEVTRIRLQPDFAKAIDNEVQVYPNPSSGTFYISMQNENVSASQLYIYNNLGQIIFKDVIDLESGSFIEEIHLPDNLPEGIYHYRFTNEHFKKDGTLIINR